MKVKKLLAISAIALASTSMLTACGNSNSSSSSDTTNTTKIAKPAKKEPKKVGTTISANKKLRSGFDKVKVGDILQQGNGGSTYKQTVEFLGEPTTTTTVKSSGVKVKSTSWTKGGVTIDIGFVKNKAISKTIAGFTFTDRGKKLDLKAFNSIKDGSSYDDLVSKYGEPDGLNVATVAGQTTTSITYFTGINAKDSNGDATFEFTNGKLTTKSQTNLK